MCYYNKNLKKILSYIIIFYYKEVPTLNKIQQLKLILKYLKLCVILFNIKTVCDPF